MQVDVNSPGETVVLAVQGEDGTILLNRGNGETAWSGVLPESQDYIVSVISTGPPMATRSPSASRYLLTSWKRGRSCACLSDRPPQGHWKTYGLGRYVTPLFERLPRFSLPLKSLQQQASNPTSEVFRDLGSLSESESPMPNSMQAVRLVRSRPASSAARDADPNHRSGRCARACPGCGHLPFGCALPRRRVAGRSSAADLGPRGGRHGRARGRAGDALPARRPRLPALHGHLWPLRLLRPGNRAILHDRTDDRQAPRWRLRRVHRRAGAQRLPLAG